METFFRPTANWIVRSKRISYRLRRSEYDSVSKYRLLKWFIDMNQVDSHVWNGFPTWVSSTRGVNIILENESLLDLSQEKTDWTTSTCRNLFSSQCTKIPVMFHSPTRVIIWRILLHSPIHLSSKVAVIGNVLCYYSTIR